MSLKNNFEVLARYNQWMNIKLYQVISPLSIDELAKNRGAFFSSILGTLNHLVVGDLAWLNRFRRHPALFSALDSLSALPIPASIDQILYDNFGDLLVARAKVDEIWLALCAELQEQDFETSLSYKNLSGDKMNKPFGLILQHVFNHQTHHRGQVTTLLSQMGIDVGATDLVVVVENV